ncbi:hypothetical protein ACFFX0_28600 [Citricoccus parietis]|uniref:Uncharacterized protein n=1 Tax=Citricoccus parietis TaxID=592307 RepID=A0ABV5G7M8_9MICC
MTRHGRKGAWRCWLADGPFQQRAPMSRAPQSRRSAREPSRSASRPRDAQPV